MTDDATVSMLARAFREAQRLRQNWLGPEHYLLAVLAEPCISTDVMAELGLTHDRLATRLGSIATINGRRIRYSESKGIKTNPRAHDVSGWAAGFAAASGRKNPTSEDWLLAVVYKNHGLISAVMHDIGISAIDVIEAARRRGVRTPDFEPDEDRPWRNLREVEVDKAEWQPIVDVLGRRHPPGSELRWGFNSRKDRPGKIQFVAEEGIDLHAIIAEARAQPKSSKTKAASPPMGGSGTRIGGRSPRSRIRDV